MGNLHPFTSLHSFLKNILSCRAITLISGLPLTVEKVKRTTHLLSPYGVEPNSQQVEHMAFTPRDTEYHYTFHDILNAFYITYTNRINMALR